MTSSVKQPNTHVHAFLKKHPLAVLSTVDDTGKPWGAAIYYIADEDFNFYFVTRAETYKYHNLEQNPYAALTITDATDQITVQLAGRITPMPVQKYMDVFFDKFAKLRPKEDYSWAPPIDKIHKGNYMPLQLTPLQLQYANYGQHPVKERSSYIEHIIAGPKKSVKDTY